MLRRSIRSNKVLCIYSLLARVEISTNAMLRVAIQNMKVPIKVVYCKVFSYTVFSQLKTCYYCFYYRIGYSNWPVTHFFLSDLDVNPSPCRPSRHLSILFPTLWTNTQFFCLNGLQTQIILSVYGKSVNIMCHNVMLE